MSVIEDLERKIQSLEDRLSEAKASLYDARLIDLGLVTGETILIHDGKEFLFQYASYFSRYNNKPWATGCVRRKDGTWSQRHTALYGYWEIKPPVATEASR